MRVLAFGEILWDIYDDAQYIGGAPLNFAAHLAKHGCTAALLSAVGQDALGEAAMQAVQKFNVSTEYISVLKDRETGKCMVTLDENFVPTYTILQNTAYDAIDGKGVRDDFDVLYFGTLALRGQENRCVLQDLLRTHTFREIFADVNIRSPFYTEETLQFAFQTATLLKISLEELPVVAKLLHLAGSEADFKAFAKAASVAFKQIKCLIITLGGDGAYVLNCTNGQESSCGSQSVRVASTVGAGDSFSAAFLFQYMQKKSIPFCLEYATAVAGYVVSEYEAVPDYSVQSFL